MKKDFSFLIGGPAGAGIEKAGISLSKAFVRGGYEVFSNGEHMSQIRGGNNFIRARVSDEHHQVHLGEIDVMVALDRQTIEEHAGEMREGSVVIFDGSAVDVEGLDFGKAKTMNLPLKELAGDPLMSNTVALGAVCGLVGFDVAVLKNVLREIFGKKSAEVIANNEKAVDAGVAQVKAPMKIQLPKVDGAKPKMFLGGNDALCIGALKAGLKFVGEYPMTPSSSVLHFMAKWSKKFGIVVKHTEDEIAACNSLIGAGFMGVRAMAATSGGGFALMGEAIGLAAMNEVPIVVVDVMRPGPATGLPTRSGQGDLRQVIHAGQDDPNKIVLLPGTPQECAEFSFLAFNLAEKYQMPVIIAYDKFLGESLYCVEEFGEFGEIDRGKILSEVGEDFKRYLRTEDGVSPRSVPGVPNGMYRATSDEHNEYGEICEEPGNRKLMQEKRMKKLEGALNDCPKPELIGPADAETTFVTWSSNVGALKEVCKMMSANILQIKTAIPFHTEEVKKLLEGAKKLILVEQNFSGQMGGLIREHTGIDIENKILKYDSRPFTAKEIYDKH